MGIGEPKATHLRVRLPPNITSVRGGGGIENWGATLRTADKTHVSTWLYSYFVSGYRHKIIIANNILLRLNRSYIDINSFHFMNKTLNILFKNDSLIITISNYYWKMPFYFSYKTL